MNFRTRIDFTDRQAKQHEKTDISLSGRTVFGLPYSALTNGVDLTTTGITSNTYPLVSTFSGNTGTTVYTFGDPRMSIDEGDLVPLTPSNSATTQYAGPTWGGYNQFVTVDGFSGYSNYSAVTYTIEPNELVDLGGGAYSGNVDSDFTVYSGGSLDWTGSTVWVDVSGITKTSKLQVTEGAVDGYVLKSDSAGYATWQPDLSGTTGTTGGTTLWSAGTGTDAIVLKNSGGVASNTLALAEGFQTTASGLYSHAEGSGTTASGHYSHAEGAGTTASGQWSHAEGLQTTASGFTAHAEGRQTIAGLYSHAEGSQTIASGDVSHAEGNVTIASGAYSHAEGLETIAAAFHSHAGGSGTTASGVTSFIHSSNSIVTGDRSVVLGGQNITGATDDSVYFLNGCTDYISGYTETNNYIDMNHGANNSIKINHLGQFGTDRYLSFDEGGGVRLARTASNYLAIGNGVSSLATSNQAIIRNTGTTNLFEINNSWGLHMRAVEKAMFFKTNNSSGSVSSSLEIGGMQCEYVTGKENTTAFPSGEFGTGLGNTATGHTGQEYYTSFISTPRSRTYDDTSYSSIRNNVIAGGSGHAIYTSTTESAIIGGTGNVIFSPDGPVAKCVVLGGTAITGGTDNTTYAQNIETTGTLQVGYQTTQPIINANPSTNKVGIGVTGATEQLDVNLNARFRTIGSAASAGALHYDANGVLTTNTSDVRMKNSIKTIDSALDKVLNLRGVTYKWNSDGDDAKERIGFIAQEVDVVSPELVFRNVNSEEGYLGVHYQDVGALLVEAVKELSTGTTMSNNRLILESQTIVSEDNNIDLNYNGNHASSLGGGITVLHSIAEDEHSEIKTNDTGAWEVSPSLIPSKLVLPESTPSVNDSGDSGNIVWDDNYIYIKTNSGWKRSALETF